MSEGEKLQKILANAGLGSRRAMEEWIKQGRIRVGDRTATLGDRADATDRIFVDGRPLKITRTQTYQTRVLIYHKPIGEISSRKDPEGRPSVFDRLPKLENERWVSVGRLDINTSGLQLFTTDGELANKLMHPSSGVDREYMVRVLGQATPEQMERLRQGIELEDGPAHFTDIVAGKGEGANRWYYVCLMEGRNREVRRLWESEGFKVNRLKRVRYGPIFIPPRLKQGNWELLEQPEVSALYQAALLEPRQVAPASSGQQEKMQRQKNKRPKAARPRRK